jgi:hypothetical protein
MKPIDTYNNICVALDLAMAQLDKYKTQLAYYVKLLGAQRPKDIKAQTYSDMPGGGRNEMGTKDVVAIIDKLSSHIELHERNVEFYKARKAEYAEALTKLEGLAYKVFYMSRIEGKSLWRVSEELGYSYDHIKRVSAEVGNATFMPPTY